MQYSVLRIYLKASYPIQIVPMGLGRWGATNRAIKISDNKVFNLHSCFTWVEQNFFFFNLSQDLKVSVELTKKSRLPASHKNMVTLGNTIHISIHAQPQS